MLSVSTHWTCAACRTNTVNWGEKGKKKGFLVARWIKRFPFTLRRWWPILLKRKENEPDYSHYLQDTTNLIEHEMQITVDPSDILPYDVCTSVTEYLVTLVCTLVCTTTCFCYIYMIYVCWWRICWRLNQGLLTGLNHLNEVEMLFRPLSISRQVAEMFESVRIIQGAYISLPGKENVCWFCAVLYVSILPSAVSFFKSCTRGLRWQEQSYDIQNCVPGSPSLPCGLQRACRHINSWIQLHVDKWGRANLSTTFAMRVPFHAL